MSQFGEVTAPARLFAMQRFIVASAVIVGVPRLISLLRDWYQLLWMPAWHDGFFLFLAVCAGFCLSYTGIAIHSTRLLKHSAERFYRNDDSRTLKKAALEETWRQVIFWGFLGGSLLILNATAFYPHGVGDWIAGWLMSCARDANISPDAVHHIYNRATEGYWLSDKFSGRANGPDLQLLTKVATSVCFSWLSFRKLQTLSSLVVSFVARAAQDSYRNQQCQALVDTLNARATTVAIKERHPMVCDVLRSLQWLILCYLGIFWLFAFCPGWLGATIGRFLEFSVRSANITGFDPGVRTFLSAVVAVYATVPVAVMTSVLLPARKPATVTVTNDGLLFSASYMVPLQFRLLRGMSDVQSVRLRTNEKNYSDSVLSLSFRSGGIFVCRLAQLVDRELLDLLYQINENARSCTFDNSVLELKSKLAARYGSPVAEPLAAKQFPQIEYCKNLFKPTMFVPHTEGSEIKAGLGVVKLLATQPFSATYLARRHDSEDSTVCIVKQYFMPSNNTSAARAMKVLEREYATVTESSKELLPIVDEVFQQGDSQYYCMEYVDGMSLRDILSSRGLQGEAQTVRLALQVIELLVQMQEQKQWILWRDITPDNLVMESSGKLRFINFGAGREFNRNVSGVVTGSLSYIAPEHLKGLSLSNSSIYSFGCLFAFMLTGVEPLPFQSVDLSLQATEHSQWLIDLVKRCTSVDELGRPSSFSAIAETLVWSLGKQDLSLPNHAPVADSSEYNASVHEDDSRRAVASFALSAYREPLSISMYRCNEESAINVLTDNVLCPEAMGLEKKL